MAVHVGEQFCIAGQIAIGGLRGEQEIDAALHRGGMRAVLMRVPGAEESQQRQARQSGVGLGARAFAVVSVRERFAAGAMVAGIPAPVRGLVPGQPVERGVHRRLGLGGATVAFGDAQTVRSRALAIHFRHDVCIVRGGGGLILGRPGRGHRRPWTHRHERAKIGFLGRHRALACARGFTRQ